MTAEARVVGKHADGFVNRYGLEAGADKRLLHVLATRTGDLAFCGFRPTGVLRPTLDRARDIERMADPQTQGFSWCQECLDGLTPQPDPIIWGPPRPEQT